MVVQRYARMFEVLLHHDYDGTGGGFELLPTARCRRNLQRYGLLLRTVPRGVLVVTELDADGLMRRGIEPGSEVAFAFSVRVRDRNLMLQTGLDFAGDVASFLHFDNTVSPGVLIGGIRMLSGLPPDGYASIADAARPVPARFTLERAGILPLRVSVRNVHGRVVHDDVARPVIDAGDPTQGRIAHGVDLAAAGPGRYELTVGTETERIYVTEGSVDRGGLGVVEIVAGPGVGADYRFAAGGAPVFRSFGIRFPLRSAFWRYVVVPRHLGVGEIGNLVVDGSAAGMAFGAAEEIDTRAHGKAARFTSLARIPFRAGAVTGITLKQRVNGSGGERILRDDLPGALATNLIRESADPAGPAFSDVYVYV